MLCDMELNCQAAVTSACRSLTTVLQMGALRERLASPNCITTGETTAKISTGAR
jgi:hypothetical protein